jgi:predicted short-subunit dehydrogenase-like oxidoreductase (DUF2520 family)
MTRARREPIAIIGAGRLASALVPRIASAGYPVVAINSRRTSPMRALARRVPGASATAVPARAIDPARVVLLMVRDDAILGVATMLAGIADTDWSKRIVLHHAGSLGPEVLEPLANAGADVGVFHPLQSLTGTSDDATLFEGARARIEGTPRARRCAIALARSIGMVPLGSDRPWTAQKRLRYHAAASLAANDLLALLSLAVDTMRAAGISEQETLPALLPLVQGTLRQVAQQGITKSLTGPAARGDYGTLKRQLEELETLSAETAEIHRLLSRRLITLAGTADGSPSLRTRKTRRPGREQKSKV